MAKSSGNAREIIYRLVAEPDPKYKKAFEDFGKAAAAVQKQVTSEAQREGKQRTANVEREARDQQRANDKAIREQQRLAKQADREADNDRKERERAAERAFKKEAEWSKKAAQSQEERGKRERADLSRTQAQHEALQRKAGAAYKDMAEGSIKAGEGVMRLFRAAVLLGGEDESMKKFVEQLRKVQGYFDLYRGVVDVVLGIAKAYRAVAAAAAAASAAQALSSKGAPNLPAAGAPNLLKLLKGGLIAAGKLGLPLAAAGVGLGIGEGINQLLYGGRYGVRRAGRDVADWWGESGREERENRRQAGLMGGIAGAGMATMKQSALLGEFEAEQAEAGQRGSKGQLAGIEQSMIRARGRTEVMSGAKRQLKMGLESKDVGIRQAAGAGMETVLQAEVAAQRDVLDHVKQKAAAESQIRKDRIEGMEKELEGAQESLKLSRSKLDMIMNAQRSAEEKWNRMKAVERTQVIEAGRQMQAGTATVRQRDILKEAGVGEVFAPELQRMERAEARRTGFGQFMETSGLAEERQRAMERLETSAGREGKIAASIKVAIDADTATLADVFAKAVRPELEKLLTAMRAEAKQVQMNQEANAAGEVNAAGGQ